MKILKIIIPILVLAIVGISTWNTIQLNRCKRSFERLKDVSFNREKIAKKLEKTIIDSQIVSMSHLNRKLVWGNITRMYPEKDSRLPIQKNPKLVLVFSEFSCNVCQDNETKFAVEVSDAFGGQFVSAIVQAGSKRYLSNYIRLNRVNFPVYYCIDDTFFTMNDIHSTPMVIVIDEENRIIASHFPIPGYTEYSEPIHQFCYDYLKRFNSSKFKKVKW